MIPVWRSLLFAPMGRADLVAKAAASEADAVILDLEDGVAPSAKAAARAAIPDAVATLQAAGKACLVRVNADAPTLQLDLAALAASPPLAVMLPKVESRADADARLGAMQDALGFAAAIALIESPAGVFRAEEIAAAPGVLALALGPEDFAAALGAPPTHASLDLPCRMLGLAAAAHGKPAYAVPVSIAEFRDEDLIRAAAEAALAAGTAGMLCIHPTQVRIANAVFSPSPASLAHAEAVLAVWRASEARGEGVASLDGHMIDKPVAEAAMRVLRKAGRSP